jgi:hypothetical protein
MEVHEFSQLNIGFNFKSRHRVVPMPTPWMAARHTLQGQPKPLEGAVFFECLKRVMTAGGGKSAFGAKHRADNPLI